MYVVFLFVRRQSNKKVDLCPLTIFIFSKVILGTKYNIYSYQQVYN